MNNNELNNITVQLGMNDKNIYQDISESGIHLWNNNNLSVRLSIDRHKPLVVFLIITIKDNNTIFEYRKALENDPKTYILSLLSSLQKGHYIIKKRLTLKGRIRLLLIANSTKNQFILSKV